ncbi:MAG: hypothetical protein JXJ17_00665 [Anaerolineae bacterium]|nr:hypothetical protein [Anaerolineae bacterium]
MMNDPGGTSAIGTPSNSRMTGVHSSFVSTPSHVFGSRVGVGLGVIVAVLVGVGVTVGVDDGVAVAVADAVAVGGSVGAALGVTSPPVEQAARTMVTITSPDSDRCFDLIATPLLTNIQPARLHLRCIRVLEVSGPMTILSAVMTRRNPVRLNT